MIDDFEKFYIGLAPQYSLQSCLDSKEDLGITRVSSSNRYNENLNPNFKDKVVNKPGEDGQYYFSSELDSTTHSINFSFDSINESQLRLLKQIQSSKKMWYLTYDNLPFKYYIVKPTGTSKISYVPFYENEQRVYKGEGTLEFICYEGCAHCWVENKDEFYNEPDYLVPKERFENIDEWKDACGLFDEKNYSYKEISMDFTKTITGDLIKYEARIENANGFFADEAEKKIILRQNPTNKNIKDNLDGIIQIFYSNNKKNPIKIKVPGYIDTVRISFNPELKVMNVQYTGYNMNIRNIEFENFKKIEWTIEGSSIYSNKIYDQVSSQNFKPAYDISYYNIKYTDLSDFDLLFYNETEEFGYLVGTINYKLYRLVGKVYNGFVNVYANDESLPFYFQQVSGESSLEGTISLTKDNHVIFDKKLYSIKIEFGIEKDFQFYKNTGFIDLNLNLTRNFGEKKCLLSYMNESNNTNQYFQLDSNKKFLYTYYTNFGDKDSKPIISIKNIESGIYALGIYKSDTLKSELSLKYTDFSLIFNILELNLLSNTYINNDKCLLLNEDKCYNQNIEYGDFFKISNEEDCFIYIVPLDSNLNPTTFTDNISAAIQTNYLFF